MTDRDPTREGSFAGRTTRQQRARRRGPRSGPDHPRHRRRRLHRLRAGAAPARARLQGARARPPLLGRAARSPTCATRSSSSRPTCATMPPTALDGVDGVIHLAGLSNDPTAEYDPDANWQMNAVATETLGRKACLERGVERLVFASSCSLYDGLPPGMHDETAPIEPRGAYATSKRYGEEALLELADRRPLPGDPAQRHRLRLQPAHALRPRRQHVRQGRAAERAADAARRRLDVAPAGRRPAMSPTR